jgi:hypothetical protein
MERCGLPVGQQTGAEIPALPFGGPLRRTGCAAPIFDGHNFTTLIVRGLSTGDCCADRKEARHD